MFNHHSNARPTQHQDAASRQHVSSPAHTFAPQETALTTAPLSQGALLKLHGTIGNRAVQRLLSPPRPAPVQQAAIQREAAPILSDEQAQAAVRYNQKRAFPVEVVRQIQQAIGVNDDGVFGTNTIRAIAAWQAQHGLTADGKVGSATFAQLLPPQTGAAPVPAPAANEAESETAAPLEQGGMVHSLVSGFSGMWDTIEEGAADIFDNISDFFGGGESPTPAPTQDEAPPTNEPPQPSELDQLMLKDRLSVDEIRRARELIDQVTDTQARGDLYEALQAKVEYHSQRDNQSTSGGKNIGDVMCNLTSLAMALSYLGIPNPDPSKQYEDALEDIRVEKKLPARTTSEGWGGVAKELGVTAEFLGYDLKKDKDWYMSTVEPKLRDGYAVMMSISGHIVRMQDVTENGLVIDDPFGVVTLAAGEGWSYSKDNKNAREGEGANRGENSVWAWNAVSAHNMRWVAALK